MTWAETLEIVTYDPTPASGSGPWASSGDDIYNTNTGNVGVGTRPLLSGDFGTWTVKAQTDATKLVVTEY